MTASEDRRWRRARRQVAIARLAALHLGVAPDGDGPRRTAAEVQLLIEHEMRERRIPLGSVPCRNTLAVLAERYRAGKVSPEDYVERPRSGRPREALDPSLVAFLEDAVDRAVYRTVARLHAAVEREAERLGVEAPSYHKVKAEHYRLGVVRHAAARHGGAATKFDALPHSTVPSTHTNHVWTADEVKLPLWARMWCRKSGAFVSIAVWLVIVQEYESRGVVGWHLVYPGRRVRADGYQMRDGYDKADVLAAFLNAAVPELAPPSTRRFAGRAPDIIRLDRHPTHGGRDDVPEAAPASGSAEGEGGEGPGAENLEDAPDPEWADESAREIPAPGVGTPASNGGTQAPDPGGLLRLGAWAKRLARMHADVFARLQLAGGGEAGPIRIPKLPGASPDNRGALEALNKYVRAMCDGADGHRDQVLPRDRLPKSIPDNLSPEQLASAIGQLRTATSATGKRVPRLVLVDPADLPSIDELRSFVDRMFSRYNHEHVHPAHGTTPANAYFESLRRDGRPGTEIVRALEPATALVDKRGLVVRHDHREFVFAPAAEGWMATVGTAITYREDPLLRGLFAEVGGRVVFLPPLATYAKDVGDKAQAARQRAAAFAYSHAARAAREVLLPPGAWGLDTARGPAGPAASGRPTAPPRPDRPAAPPADPGDSANPSPLDAGADGRPEQRAPDPAGVSGRGDERVRSDAPDPADGSPTPPPPPPTVPAVPPPRPGGKRTTRPGPHVAKSSFVDRRPTPAPPGTPPPAAEDA